MNSSIARLFIVMALAVIGSSSCTNSEVTEEEAKQIALAKIGRAQTTCGIDAKRVPPLYARRSLPDGFDFQVRDSNQKVSIFVHVSRTGLPEISCESFDEETRREAERQRAVQAAPPKAP